MKTKYFILPLLMLFIACNTASDKAPETFNAESSTGLVIGTLTFEGEKPINDIYRFFYYPVSGDKKFIKRNDGKIQIKAREGNEAAFNGDFNDRKTYLFVIEREPGKYAFTQYNYLDHIGPTGMVVTSKKFAIPFEVKKGEISYIGELTYNDKAEPGTPRIIVSGNFERDLPEFKKKFPSINWGMATDNTTRSGDTGEGLVEFQ